MKIKFITLALALGVSSIHAQTTLYLSNSVNAWGNAIAWNTSATTDPGSLAWTNGNIAVISALAANRSIALQANRTVAGIQLIGTTGNQVAFGNAFNLSFTSGASIDVASGQLLRFNNLALSGSNGFTKNGSGTLALASATDSGFSGAINVNAGKLEVTNAAGLEGLRTSGLITVNGGLLTTLNTATETTRIYGGLAVNSGTLIIGGAVAGSGQSITFLNGSDFSLVGGTLELGINHGTTVTFDQFVGGAGSTFSLTGGTISLNPGIDGINYTSTYQLFNNFDSGAITGVTITGYDTANWIASIGTNGVLSFAVIPEPGTSMFLISGAVGLLALRKRKRRYDR